MVLLHFVSKQFSCAIDHWFYLWCDFLLVFFRVLLSFVGIFCWLIGVFYNIIVIFCFCLCIVTEYFILTLGILRNRMKKGFFCYQSLTLWHSFLLLIIDIRSALGRVAVYLWYREKKSMIPVNWVPENCFWAHWMCWMSPAWVTELLVHFLCSFKPHLL